MSVRFGSDGTIYCNTVRYNYKMARNLVSDNTYGNISAASWTFSGSATAGTTVHGYKTYRSFVFPVTTNPMATQSMPTPIAGHKYYGGCMFMTTGSTFTTSDSRFEWYTSDTSDGTMVFATKNVATSGEWVLLSSIQSLSSVASGSWNIRNFQVNPSTASYCSKLIIVDLTDTFGSGNEPTKEWCDANIREWEVISNYGNVSNNITNSVLDTRYTVVNLTRYTYGYLTLDSNWEPRDYMYMLDSNSSLAEGYLYSASNFTLNNTYMYYFQIESYVETNTGNFQLYFPEAEPNMGSVPAVKGEDFSGGGGMGNWKRTSLYGDRSSFTSGSYQMRLDMDNYSSSSGGYISWRARITALVLLSMGDNITQYNSYNGTSITVSDVNKEWCDRWIDGRDSPIIHIKDPSNTTIKFNTDYDIICNDIEIRPEVSKVTFRSDGTIVCKKLVRSLGY